MNLHQSTRELVQDVMTTVKVNYSYLLKQHYFVLLILDTV